ncbi:MAG: FAD-binding oxidoreductase [Chloroflexota bacterium]
MLDLETPREILDLASTPRRFAPANAEELAAALREAAEAGQAVVPWGGGTEQRLGVPPSRCDVVLETRNLSGIIAYAPEDLTVSVQADTTVAEVRAALAPHGQFLPFDVPEPEQATIGGILAANTASVRRFRYGAARDLGIGMTTALSSGGLCKAGGKVVKNVAGYDMCKLWVGSLGTLGVFTSANFRVQPVCKVTTSVSCRFPTWEAAVRTGLTLAGQSQAWSALIARGGVDPCLMVVAEGFAGSVGVAVAAVSAAAAREGGKCTVENDPLAVENTLRDLARFAGDYPERDGALLRGSVAPGLLLQAPASLLTSFAAAGLPSEWQADVGVGSVLCRVTGTDDRVADAVRLARSALAPLDGRLIVAAGSAALRRMVDPWGAPEGAAPLSRAIKAKMDPTGTLNPGRFCYGL